MGIQISFKLKECYSHKNGGDGVYSIGRFWRLLQNLTLKNLDYGLKLTNSDLKKIFKKFDKLSIENIKDIYKECEEEYLEYKVKGGFESGDFEFLKDVIKFYADREATATIF